MYEPVKDAWGRYANLLGQVVLTDDTRLKTSAEVHARLGQLDIILAKLHDELHLFAQSSGTVDHNRALEAWDLVSIFTDSFYFFGWRLIDILNGDGQGAFPRLEPVAATGFLSVRENFLDSPEKKGQYFTHGMELREELQVKIDRAIAALQGKR
jgi:hypothetical protein